MAAVPNFVSAAAVAPTPFTLHRLLATSVAVAQSATDENTHRWKQLHMKGGSR